MKFAPVVPLRIAQAMDDISILGDYHLLLAHDVVAQGGMYHTLYRGKRGRHIIMDNSVVELGRSVPAKMLHDAVNRVNADVLALPDVLNNRQETLESSFDALTELTSLWAADSRAGLGWTGRSEPQYMFLPQGEDTAQWLKCLIEFAKSPSSRYIRWVGIPRVYHQALGGSRVDAIEFVRMYCPDKFIHLFGMSDNVYDDIKSARYGARAYPGIVKGMDSAVPVRMASDFGETLTPISFFDHPRGDWWDRAPLRNMKIVEENMANIRQWINP